MILPKDVGKEFLVHNGKTFIPSKIDQEMVGQRFGEFSNTRKRVFHKMNKKRVLDKYNFSLVLGRKAPFLPKV
uniref:Ribosomal protein S19 n=1 Tax=Botryococcus braunii TaxID=38881 RepID=A0A0U2EZZ2_BOTBR|nr:ribosomal protein S19 [Botryococcus braunii]AKU37096.1 ribosomal protein S19 [Botryococcus braunii]